MSGRFAIVEDDPGRPEVAALLQRHLAAMAKHSPPESCHALDVDGLRSPEITFWSVWDGAELAGCGALKELDPTHGEIKSMHTAPMHLRKGVASSLLGHMIAEARGRGYLRLSLETGSMDAYEPARSLYARFGFEVCGPFAGYVVDRHSVFMTRRL
jgi:putative acetyltransferase